MPKVLISMEVGRHSSSELLEYLVVLKVQNYREVPRVLLVLVVYKGWNINKRSRMSSIYIYGKTLRIRVSVTPSFE